MAKANSNSITERAMLVNLNIQQWVGAKHDKKISKEVARNHGADESMGRYQKRLVGKDALERIRQIAGAARQEHYKRTLPWTDGGTRILSSKGYFEYSQAMREFQSQWEPAVADFLAQYPQLIEQAKQKLNGLFNADDYPSPRSMREKFAINFNVLPMPTAQDFRVELGDAETARIKAEIEQAVNESLQTAMGDVWNRIREVVAHMHERLTAYNDSRMSFFLNTLVSNISDLLEILPSLNITQDADLSAIAQKMTALTEHTPEQLRENDGVRQETIAKAAEILKEMEDFV